MTPHALALPQLRLLYENYSIFDKFECAVSGDANNMMTGSYNNTCHMFDQYGQYGGAFEVRVWFGRICLRRVVHKQAFLSAWPSSSPQLAKHDEVISL